MSLRLLSNHFWGWRFRGLISFGSTAVDRKQRLRVMRGGGSTRFYRGAPGIPRNFGTSPRAMLEIAASCKAAAPGSLFLDSRKLYTGFWREAGERIRYARLLHFRHESQRGSVHVLAGPPDVVLPSSLGAEEKYSSLIAKSYPLAAEEKHQRP